jgi:hypothetical protein
MSINLTNKQYIELLERAFLHLNTVKTVSKEDSITTGSKHTASNVGLCNDNLTTREIALFPDEWPKRKAMKYTRKRHKCPLDNRSNKENLVNGCFYTCGLFKDNLNSIEDIKKRFKEQIIWAKENLLEK